jgi:CRP-like cAMP-binding protein
MDPTTQASSLLDRILEKATDNLRIAKIFQQMGLDPDNITYQAILDRLLDIAIANITIANMCALIGAGFFVATLLTRTMVPLRVSNMISCFFFILFGALGKDIRVFLLYLLLLPINGIRLYQMLRLVKKARNAAQGDTSMEWLKPFMTQRKYRKGDVLFKKGDAANEMYLTVTGKFVVSEIGVELPPGRLMGELGFLTPSNKRTATVECLEDGAVLTITYDKLLELYFQNPQFGYYFLVLTSQRLLENIGRLEEHIAQLKFESKSAGGARPETPGRQVPVHEAPKQPQKTAAQPAAAPVDVMPAEPSRRRVEMWKAVAAIHREVGQAYLLRRT